MVRLQRFIRTSDEAVTLLREFIRVVNKDCKPWMKGVVGDTARRGMDVRNDIIYNKKVRTDRRPSDTNIETHDGMNDAFNRKFGWKPRSEGLFVVGGGGNSSNYGNEFVVFPIGPYKFIWSPIIRDLWAYIEWSYDDMSADKKFEEIVKKYSDKNIKKALDSKNEIMIKCKAYHALDIEFLYYNDFIESGSSKVNIKELFKKYE